jgi:hypothetical protein
MAHPSVHQCHACYELLLRFLYMRNLIQNQMDRNDGREAPDVVVNPFRGVAGAVPRFGSGSSRVPKSELRSQRRRLMQHFLAAAGMPNDPATMARLTSPFRQDEEAIQHAGLMLQHANHMARVAARTRGMALPDGVVNVQGQPMQQPGGF